MEVRDYEPHRFERRWTRAPRSIAYRHLRRRANPAHFQRAPGHRRSRASRAGPTDRRTSTEGTGCPRPPDRDGGFQRLEPWASDKNSILRISLDRLGRTFAAHSGLPRSLTTSAFGSHLFGSRIESREGTLPPQPTIVDRVGPSATDRRCRIPKTELN